jgi:DNA-binding response OmpR family regulator
VDADRCGRHKFSLVTRGGVASLAKILIVESDVLQAIALEDEVVDAGHEVVGPASSVAAALELINRKPPDLALIDVLLRDGELAYALARKLDARNLAFAFVTTVPVEKIRVRWQGRPVLPKPYIREEFRHVLANLMAGCRFV